MSFKSKPSHTSVSGSRNRAFSSWNCKCDQKGFSVKSKFYVIIFILPFPVKEILHFFREIACATKSFSVKLKRGVSFVKWLRFGNFKLKSTDDENYWIMMRIKVRCYFKIYNSFKKTYLKVVEMTGKGVSFGKI